MKRIIITLIISILILSANEEQYAFTKLGQIDTCGTTVAIAVDNFNRIFVARSNEGLSVYSFNIVSGFTELTSVNDDGTALDIAVTPYGQTVFLANNGDGLRIYSFESDSLTCIYNMEMEKSGGSSLIYNDEIKRVKLKSNNELAIVRYTKWEDTMRPRIYEYGAAFVQIWNGDSLSEVLYGCSNPSDPYDGSRGRISAWDTRDQDNTIIACGSDGIRLGSYHSVRKSTGDYVRDVHILDNGTILTANSDVGLKAYMYSDQFNLLDHIDDGGKAMRIYENTDGILFLANGGDGIRAYSYDTTFHSLAHANDGGNAMDIAELSNGTLIVANVLGLIAYCFADTSSNDENDAPEITGYILSSNYPNPFNAGTHFSYMLPKTNDVSFLIYNIQGKLIRSWDFQDQLSGIHEFTWNGKDQNGKSLPSGVYIYRMVAGEFVKSKKMVLLK